MPVPYRVVAVVAVAMFASLAIAIIVGVEETMVLAIFVLWVIVAVVVELHYKLRQPNVSRKEATH